MNLALDQFHAGQREIPMSPMVANALRPYDAGYALPSFTLHSADPSLFFDFATIARLEAVRIDVDPHGVFSQIGNHRAQI